jgi:hypothetical protein
MHKQIVTAIAAFVLGGISTSVLLAQAQTSDPAGAPPPAAMDHGPGAHGPWAHGRWGHGPWEMGRWHRGAVMGVMAHRMAERRQLMRDFALIYRPDDRALTPADVQKIAEAFLLWNGNHTWKVTNVATAGTLIGFDLATKDGSIIAHFTMDPKTGHLDRTS